MRRILIILIVIYSCSCFGQIPLMLNNKPNYDIKCILENKYNNYKDTCIYLINNYRYQLEKEKYLKAKKLKLNVNDLKIEVLCYIYLKNKDLKIDSTTILMNEILVDTISLPNKIHFYKDNLIWGIMDFFYYKGHYVELLDYKEEKVYVKGNYWYDIISFGADNVFFIKGDYDGVILQKGNNIYYYTQFNGRIEPLYKYLMRKQSKKKLDDDIMITN